MAGTLGVPYSSAREVQEEFARESDYSFPLVACVGEEVALYEKFGFEIEGTHKRFAYRDGEYVDAYVMARLR